MTSEKVVLNINDFLRGRVIFTLFFMISTVHAYPYPLNPSVEPEEETSIAAQRQLVEIREKDDSKNFLRAVALFIVILLVFSMVICMCATYCCIYWALQCPGTATMQLFLDAFNRSCNRIARARRNRRSEKRNVKRSMTDLPPSYDVIIASDLEQELALKPKAGFSAEEEPPSYIEAILLYKECGAS